MKFGEALENGTIESVPVLDLLASAATGGLQSLQKTKTIWKDSPYQTAIYNFIETGEGNAVIDAVAGSGKTTTIVKALSRIPSDQKIIFVAFNKAIVNELITKVPKHVEVKTMHAFGYGAVRYHLGPKVLMKDDKIMDIIKQLYPTWNIPENVSEGFMFRVRQIVDLARLNLSTNINDLYDIVEHYGIDILDSEVEKAWVVVGVARNFKTLIDMTDMVYLPAYFKWKCKQYDWVFVDECQDLNKAQQELLKLMVKPKTGRFVAVGDPRQAIYGFAGADSESFKALMSMPNTTTLPLSVNYRCPLSVIRLAKEIVPQLEAHPDAEEGEVVENGKWKEVNDGDYVLCRNVRPLVKLCMEFLVNGQRAHVRGRDIGANLVTMLNRTKQPEFEKAVLALYSDSEKMIKKSVARGKDEQEVRNSMATKNNADKIQAIEIIGQHIEKTDEVVRKIETLFTDDKKGIILSTIHKAKGLEADSVHILNAELMPSLWAKKTWEKEQEENLIYVAYTRAKQKLSFITDYDGTK